MELGPKSQSLLWLWSRNYRIAVYMGPLGQDPLPFYRTEEIPYGHMEPYGLLLSTGIFFSYL